MNDATPTFEDLKQMAEVRRHPGLTSIEFNDEHQIIHFDFRKRQKNHFLIVMIIGVIFMAVTIAFIFVELGIPWKDFYLALLSILFVFVIAAFPYQRWLVTKTLSIDIKNKRVSVNAHEHSAQLIVSYAMLGNRRFQGVVPGQLGVKNMPDNMLEGFSIGLKISRWRVVPGLIIFNTRKEVESFAELLAALLDVECRHS